MPRPFALAVPLVALLATACASTGAIPRPFPSPGTGTSTGSTGTSTGTGTGTGTSTAPSAPPAPSAPSAPFPADGYSIAGTALSLRGIPYRDGGADPSGFDCSGLVHFVLAQHGVPSPRTVAEQFRLGQAVTPQQIAAGDLLFFSTKGPGATHVAMSIGGDEFVHAPATNGVVRVERLSASYWSSRFVGARRVW